ncbi:MAG: DUF917 domain-containing protein [Alteromonadaceae bacterium]|nr:DUF917 domain-containing protein [Alteromonadaceae bacterium]
MSVIKGFSVLDEHALEDLANGCAFLGSGGGGDPYYSILEITSLLSNSQFNDVTIISADTLDDDAVVAPCGWLGAPTVSLEKLPSGTEATAGLARLEQVLGKKIDAIFPVEIGGSNGLAPFILALKTGLPIVDCDGMGRAFPESQMVIFNVVGISASPAVMTDAKGNTLVIDTVDNEAEELVARAAAVALGGSCHLFEYVQTGKQVKQHAIHGTISLALEIGRKMRRVKSSGSDPTDALLSVIRQNADYGYGGILFEGKITDVKRETNQGFSVGHLLVETFDGQQQMEVKFQNENLIAKIGERVVATVPDIISVLDCETAQTITTEQLRYGQRVKIVSASAPGVLRSPAALAIMGPSAFGMVEQYQPVELLNGWES